MSKRASGGAHGGGPSTLASACLIHLPRGSRGHKKRSHQRRASGDTASGPFLALIFLNFKIG